jgi:hypothetical protein
MNIPGHDSKQAATSQILYLQPTTREREKNTIKHMHHIYPNARLQSKGGGEREREREREPRENIFIQT